jgi:translation initiation factor IF-2
LKVAGYPESGVIYELVDDIAKAIVEEHQEIKPKEERIIKPAEIRKTEV